MNLGTAPFLHPIRYKSLSLTTYNKYVPIENETHISLITSPIMFTISEAVYFPRGIV